MLGVTKESVGFRVIVLSLHGNVAPSGFGCRCRVKGDGSVARSNVQRTTYLAEAEENDTGIMAGVGFRTNTVASFQFRYGKKGVIPTLRAEFMCF
jgi:hypothetical protein